MPAEDLRSRYLKVLLDRLSSTRYPSAPMLDRIEMAITDRGQAVDYVGQLLEAIEQDEYPSPELLARVNGLISVIESRAE